MFERLFAYGIALSVVPLYAQGASIAMLPPLPLLSPIFTTQAVLQRAPASVVLWGWAAPRADIFVSLDDVALIPTSSDTDGLWRLALPPTLAGGPHIIAVNASAGTSGGPVGSVIEDVLFGEVVLCSGQSNMDMPVSYAFNASAEAAASAAYSDIRLFNVAPNSSSTPQPIFPAGATAWVPASAPSLPASSFSAICWFTGRDLHNGLGGDVPVGLVHSALGGTAIQQWTAPSAVSACPPATTGPKYAYSGLYNAMIAPMTIGPLSLGTIVWYQGEANVLQASFYECALAAHIESWLSCAAFCVPPGPARFLVSQLHAWNGSTDASNVYYYGAIASLRNSQARAVAALAPGAALVTAVDGGDPYAPATSIHPRGKQLPSARLAAAALAQRFNAFVDWASPVYGNAIARTTDAALIVDVSLGSVGDGQAQPLVWRAPDATSNSSRCPTDLTIPEFMCSWFEIMQNDAPFPNGTWVNASATINAAGTGLVLSAAATVAGAVPAGTRNGWNAWPVVNIYSASGLPLLPWQEPI